MSKILFDKIPVHNVSANQNELFKDVEIDIQNEYSNSKTMRIDSMLFDFYNLNKEEREIIGFIEIQ